MAYPPHTSLNFTKTIHDDIYPAIDPTKSDLAQPSKVVLITGAGRGIGRAVAIQYAKSGVTCIILCARTASELDDVKQEINKIDRQIRVRNIALSITDEAQVIAAAETVKKEEGRLDVLVNNAGVGGFPWVPIGDGIAESWWNTWNVHVNGTYLMLKAFLPLLVETAKKYDTIVDVLNTTSIGAQFTMPGASAYQTSKFAILRLSEFVMAEYGEQGVNCVALSPGAVKTKMSIGSPVEPMCNDTADLCGGFVVWFTKGQRTWLNGRYVAVNWDVDELEAMKSGIVNGDKLKMRMVV